MTKEILIELSDKGNLTQYELENFFSQNVCIHKDSVIQTNIVDMKTWVEIPINQLRIKPSEPIYEWQWLVIYHQAYIVSDNGRFMTFEETCDGMIPIEETKRVRQ